MRGKWVNYSEWGEKTWHEPENSREHAFVGGDIADKLLILLWNK